ncbi:MAG TPA: PIG-L family deacetylase [Bryobacteraceae bacterium]|nr:PIG-L family deacetylase [Bryobacteraceae bacterium]
MMHRRSFPMPGLAGAAPQVNGGEPIVVKDEPGMPHRGKVFAAVHAHLDDIPYYAAGLCAKLMSEGYTGYILRTSNDERCGGRSTAENILSNEQDHFRMAAALGFKDVFDFYYQNHDMDGISYIDLRGRLILIFRMLQVDTILSFNPWGHAEENPDHWVTGRAVEEACWMAGMPNDFHEHLEAGIQPHTVGERYYFYAREGQPYNRVVDIGSHVEKKIDAIVECKSQGDGNRGSIVRAQLARQGKRLPLLGNDDRAADRAYVRQFLLEDDREHGKPHNLEFAERFYYIDRRPAKSKADEYIEKNAVNL